MLGAVNHLHTHTRTTRTHPHYHVARPRIIPHILPRLSSRVAPGVLLRARRRGGLGLTHEQCPEQRLRYGTSAVLPGHEGKGGGTGRPAAAAAQPESRLRHGARRHLDPGVHIQAPQGGAGNLGIAAIKRERKRVGGRNALWTAGARRPYDDKMRGFRTVHRAFPGQSRHACKGCFTPSILLLRKSQLYAGKRDLDACK